MATRRTPEKSLSESLREQLAAIHKKYRPIKARYYVVEYTPPSEDDFGRWVPDSWVKVSEYFPDEESANSWMEDHIPAPGTMFSISVDTLCEHTELTWMPGKWLN